MRLHAIEFEGFRGARGKVRLEIPHGFLVLSGRNGSGKSTVCDAIEFALTGAVRGSDKHKEKGEGLADYVWWRGDGRPEDMYVALEIIGDDGETLVIRRTTSGLEGVDQATLASLLCGEAHTLEEPLQQLSQVMLLRDEAITRLSVDLKETDRFDLVRAVLGSDALTRYETRAKELDTRLKAATDKAEAEYRASRSRVSDVTARLSNAKSTSPSSEAVAAARQALESEHTHASDSDVALVRAAEEALASCRLASDQLSRATELLRSAADLGASGPSPESELGETLESRVSSLEETIRLKQGELEAVDAEISEIGSDNPVTVSLSLLHEHGAHLGLRDDACPLCRSELTEEEFAARLSRLQDELNQRSAKASQLVSRKTTLVAEIATARKERDRVAQELGELKRRAQRAKELIREAAELAASHDSTQTGSAPPTIEQLDERVAQLRNRASSTEKSLAILAASSTRGRIVELQRELDAAKKDLARAEGAVSKATNSRGKAKAAYDTVRRMKGELIDERLAELEPLLLDLYRRLRPHCDWQEMRYRLRGDVRRMLSFEIGDGLNPNFVFSSGQRRAAGLAFLLSLHLSAEWPRLETLILDDPVQHIDDYRALHLIEVLAAVRRSGRQVICAVEDAALGKLLARRLRSQPQDEGGVASMSYSSSLGVSVSSHERVAPFRPSVLVSA